MKFLLCLFLSGCGTYVSDTHMVTYADAEEISWNSPRGTRFYARTLIHSKPTEAATTGIAKGAIFLPVGL